MKANEFKKIIKEAVKDAFREELNSLMKEVLLETIKSNKNINENKTLSFTTDNIPHNPSPVNTKKAYMDILGEMAAGPKSPLAGDFQLPRGEINTVSEGSSLPQGQLSLDQISKLLKI